MQQNVPHGLWTLIWVIKGTNIEMLYPKSTREYQMYQNVLNGLWTPMWVIEGTSIEILYPKSTKLELNVPKRTKWTMNFNLAMTDGLIVSSDVYWCFRKSRGNEVDILNDMDIGYTGQHFQGYSVPQRTTWTMDTNLGYKGTNLEICIQKVLDVTKRTKCTKTYQMVKIAAFVKISTQRALKVQ